MTPFPAYERRGLNSVNGKVFALGIASGFTKAEAICFHALIKEGRLFRDERS